MTDILNGERWRVDVGDAVDWLASMPAEAVDCIVTDVAYESLEKHRKVGTTTRLKKSKSSSSDWFPVFPNERLPSLFGQMHRVMRRHTHLYFFCDNDTMFVAKPMAEAAGFVLGNVIVWDKELIGMGYNWRRRHENILFLKKGKRKLLDLGFSDVIRCRSLRGKGALPTEKPWQLATPLILNSSLPGEIICDPFVGSGAFGEAALYETGRRFIGCDLVESVAQHARVRLGGL